MDRRTFIGLAAALPALGGASRAFAGHAPVFAEDGVAIRGADAVAYYRESGPVAGSVSEQVQWRGAAWLFASAENREAFEWNPRRFAPRFGGYCAYTLSQGSLGPIDPHAYSIHDGRLYLMRSPEIRDTWRENIERNIKLAEEHWPSALG